MPSIFVLKVNGQRSLSYSLSPGIAHPTLPTSTKHDPTRGDPRRESKCGGVNPCALQELSQRGLDNPALYALLAVLHPGWVTLKANLKSLVGHSWFTQCKTSKMLPISCFHNLKNSNFDMFKMKNRAFSTHRSHSSLNNLKLLNNFKINLFAKAV